MNICRSKIKSMIQAAVSVCLFLGSLSISHLHAQVVFDLGSSESVSFQDWRVHSGDEPEWTSPDFDDSLWTKIDPDRFQPEEEDVHFIRTGLTITGDRSAVRPLVLRLKGVGYAYELFWDGRLIHRNGAMNTDAGGPMPGKCYQCIKIGEELLAAGDHLIAIRMVHSENESKFCRFSAALEDWEAWKSVNSYLHFNTVFHIGVAFSVLVLSLTLFFGLRKRKYFLVLMTISIISIIFEYSNLKILNRIDITVYDYYSVIQAVSCYLTEILFVGFFIFFFNIPQKNFHMINLGILFSVIIFAEFGFPQIVNIPRLLYTSFSLGVLIYAFLRKKDSSLLLLSAYIFYMITFILGLLTLRILPKHVIWLNSLSNVLLPACLVIAICKRFVQEDKSHEQLRLKSQRLGTEMLKKTIQPHFIMNTLLSIIQLISKDPKKAIHLIELLAEEFELTNAFSSKKLIPLGEELKLCRAHLDLMGLRKKTQYDLITEDVDPSENVPPMIFHTLIENGLTHAFQPDENGVFHLSTRRNGNEITYIFKNGGSRLTGLNDRSLPENDAGLGTRYVKSRLEENFPGRWTLDYGLRNNEWVVQISWRR